MSDHTIILCADGSELSTHALALGLALITPDSAPVVVTVVELEDAFAMTGSGFAGGVMDQAEFDERNQSLAAAGEAVVKDVAIALGVPGAETKILFGNPGDSLCDFAAERSATAIVIGSRGRGGFKRALLGSVSDHVVRNAPCPVIVTSATGEPEPG